MARNILHDLAPTLLVMKVFNCYPFSKKNSVECKITGKAKFYTSFMNLLTLIVFLYLILTLPNVYCKPRAFFVCNYIQRTIGFLAAWVNAVVPGFQIHQKNKMLLNINTFDNRINSNEFNRKSITWLNQSLILLFPWVYNGLAKTCIGIVIAKQGGLFGIDHYASMVMFAALASNECANFALHVYELKCRFGSLNKYVKIGRIDGNPMTIKDAYELYCNLKNSVESLNSYYSVQLFVWVVYYWAGITGSIYLMAHGIFYNASLVLTNAVLDIFTVVWSCHSLCSKANKLGSRLFSANCPIFKRNYTSLECASFGLYLHKNPIRIRAGKLFTLNYSFLLQMTTFIISIIFFIIEKEE